MDRWTEGRVALVGDAAFCVSLVAGQGSAFVGGKQEAARNFASFFAPQSRGRIFLGNQIMKPWRSRSLPSSP
jgi:hypothetical protein